MNLRLRNGCIFVALKRVLLSGLLLAAATRGMALDVSIPDAGLEAALREALNKPVGALQDSELAGLTSLNNAATRSIVDITGLQYCTGLISLSLYDNNIVDIGPLSGLTKLTALYLGYNKIVDLSPLAGLTALTYLNAYHNTISDLSPLANLINLTSLSLQQNAISNIAPITGLTGLKTAVLDTNLISDLTPLSTLVQLTYLTLNNNQITDISPLASLTALTNLNLAFNALTSISALTGMTSLTELELNNNHVVDIGPLSGHAAISYLNLSSNEISGIDSLSGVTSAQTMNLMFNSICDLSPLAANTGLSTGDFVFVGQNPLGPDACATQIPVIILQGATVDSGNSCDNGGVPCAAEGEGTAEGTSSGEGASDITIPDPALEAALRDTLSKPVDPLTLSDLLSITELYAEGYGIISLTGLEGCANLQTAYLGNNSIVDLSPLAGLSGLTHLELSFNPDLNLGGLTPLTGLSQLGLTGNGISDLGFLTSLTQLTELNLSANLISNLSGIASCTGLTYLELSGNPLSDISALASLSALTSLYLNDDEISSLAPIQGLLNLTNLGIKNNRLSGSLDISTLFSLRHVVLAGNSINSLPGLSALTELVQLDVSRNQLTALPSLAGLINLTSIDLSENPLLEAGPLASLTNLESLTLRNTSISNIAALSGLIHLNDLDISGTGVTELDPLLDNTGMGNGDVLNLRDLPISETSCGEIVPNLIARGVSVFLGNACLPIPAADLYVDDSATGGINSQGTAKNPFPTLAIGLAFAATYATANTPVTIHMAAGNYPETASMVPNVSIAGAGQGDTTISPSASQLLANAGVALLGAQDTSLESLAVVLPLDAASGTRMVSMVNVSMNLRDVDLFGAQAPDSIGVFVRGEDSSDSLVKDCRIRSVGIGLDIAFSSARFAFNEFENINGEAAIKISQATGATPVVGDLSDLVTTGSNTFSAVSAVFIKSDNPADTIAQANQWENFSNENEVVALIEGAANIAKPLFTLDVVKNPAPAATALVTVLDNVTGLPVSGVNLTLVPTRATLPESGTVGVYSATVAPGRYTFRCRKAGFDEQVELHDVHTGIDSFTIRLGAAPGDGEATTPPFSSGDTNHDGLLDLSEVLRVVQLYNGGVFSCGFADDGFQLGAAGGQDCPPHSADYDGGLPDWHIDLSELLRMVQIFNSGGYHPCLNAEDGYCPGRN